MRWNVLAPMLVAAAVLGCAPASGPAGQGAGRQDSGSGGAASRAPKQVAVAISEDPGNFWDAVTGGGGSGSRELGHAVNQFLATTASDGTPVARLLAELPSIDRGTWRLLPDGGMETTYQLRPGVTWHDGRPLSAEDILFSWEVNRDPDVPNSNAAVVRLISRMEARDASTVAATWTELYPFADRLSHRELYTLPRHLLEKTHQEAKDALLSQPYFSEQYVGLGPYRVARWDRGSHLELQAYDGYFLGRPKIDTIRIHFISDTNTTLANLKAHAIQSFLTPGGPDFETMSLLKREWETTGYGTAVVEVARWKFIEPQKGRLAQPSDLGDARARQALLYGIDRAELARTVYAEHGVVADSWVHPSFKHYPQLQDAITRYTYDPARASAILTELGWRRGGDGVLEKGSQRFAVLMRTRDEEKEALIIADNWKGIGVAGAYEQQTAQELRDRQARAQYTGIDISRGSMPPLTIIRSLVSQQIPTAENRWAGSNRGTYANPAWDELGRRLLSALDDGKRVEVEREMVRMATVDLPLMPLMYDPDLIATGGGLTGILPATGTAHNGQIMHTWNMHEWDLRT